MTIQHVPSSSVSMDDLPPALVLEILSRLYDSADIARCQLACKTFNILSREVRSINLICSLSRYLKSRCPETQSLITPFKTVFNNLVRNFRTLEHITISVEKSLGGVFYDDVGYEFDDLYLTDVGFVKEWLPRVCGELRSLSISDFWIQSCWRRSDILAVISSCCNGLLELELKNAWLSVDGLNPMPMLTCLTLEFIRLDDEDLNKVNHCFPCLQVLNLRGVGGLKKPKIHLFHLKTCQWTVSNAPHSLTIIAPNLAKLKLKCIEPASLILDTPLLTDFYLSLEKTGTFKVNKFLRLKDLHIESKNIGNLICSFPSGTATKSLTVDSLNCTVPIKMEVLKLEALFDVFPNMISLTLRSETWSDMEACFLSGGLQNRIGMKGLKEIIAQLVIHDIDVTLLFIYSVLDKCTNLSDFGLLIHHKVDHDVASSLISRCTSDHPKIRWRWGMWKEGTEDNWVSFGI